MLNETNIATWASMVKWRNQCAPHLVIEEIDIASHNCALCVQYVFNNVRKNRCLGCPLDASGNCCFLPESSYRQVSEHVHNYSYVFIDYEDRLFDAVEQMFDALADLCPPMPDN